MYIAQSDTGLGCFPKKATQLMQPIACTQQAHSQILGLDAESFHDSSIVHNAICRHQQGRLACTDMTSRV